MSIDRKITQSELAAKIGMDVSTLSRFISNATGKLGDENIKKIAKEFEVSTDFLLGITFDDLVQEGCLGLMGCVEKFNPDGGNKFLTYAAPAIRNSMIDYIRSQSNPLKQSTWARSSVWTR